MSALSATLPGSGTFARGIHPPGMKHFSADAAIEVVPNPAKLAIPLLQHAGAACEAVVKPKDEVAVGDLIGTSEAFISAPVHASIAGTVVRGSVATLANGRHVQTVPLKASDAQMSPEELRADMFGGEWDLDVFEKGPEPEAITEAVKKAGIVGQGGAAFPTYVKFLRNAEKPVDTLIVNGCECEPYLTADYRLMLEAPLPVVSGALLAARACGATRVVIAVEDNKPEAIAELQEVCAGTPATVVAVKTKYPMGGERQVIPAVLKREVPTGGLPLDVGVVVINVGTAAAIARAVLRGKPLTHRVVTVTGAGIVRPSNLLVPIGMPYQNLIDFCGGLTADAARVIGGGPMMGFTLGTLNSPVTKGTSGITILTHDDVKKADETTCIRCGRCVDQCPLRLVPTKLALAARHRNWEVAKRHHMMACMECGCCAYVCPAGIPLVQLIRLGKAEMPRE